MLPNDIIFVVIAALGNILLGLITFYKNRKSSTSKLFLAFSSIISLYLVTNQLTLHQDSPEKTLYWIKVVMFVVPFLNVFYWLLVSTFPQPKMTTKKPLLILAFVVTWITALLSPFGLVFTGIAIESGNIKPTPGPGMLAFLLHVIIFLGGGFVVLLRKFAHATGNERNQLKLFLIGTLFMYAAIIFTNLILVVVFSKSSFVGLLPIYTFIFVGSISYAIIRHRFLDINLLIVRVVTYSGIVFVIAFLYSLGLIVVGRLAFSINLTLYEQAVLIGLTVLITFSFQEIRKLLEKITNKLFFQQHYNTDEVVSKLTRGMASTIVLDELTNLVLTELKVPLKYHRAAFILFTAISYNEINSEKESYNLTQEEVEALRLNALETVVFDALEEGKLKALLRRNNIMIVSPIQTKNKYVGLFLLGARESGDMYTEQDLQVLEILSSEAAVAIQNALAYEEIRKFNITLQEEIKKATADLVFANARLTELDKLKDEFVSLASHELRTPMSGIKASLSTILEGYSGTITNETREMLTAAFNENDRLIRLVNNLLDTSRIESGKFTFSMGKVNMNALITEVVGNMQIAGKEKNIYIKYDKTQDLPDITADEDKMKEVVINLIGNATKFTSQGGITVKARAENDMLTVSVTDTGTGIHKEDFELLFQKFSQVNRDASKKIGGSGLGLYISKQIVEGHGGKMWLESEVGKGTTFYFTLPLGETIRQEDDKTGRR